MTSDIYIEQNIFTLKGAFYEKETISQTQFSLSLYKADININVISKGRPTIWKSEKYVGKLQPKHGGWWVWRIVVQFHISE